MLNKLLLPPNLSFSDLGLDREPATRRPRFRKSTFVELCRYNGFDPTTTLSDTDLTSWMISEWYHAHLALGGAVNPVAQQIVCEVMAVGDAFGGQMKSNANLPR